MHIILAPYNILDAIMLFSVVNFYIFLFNYISIEQYRPIRIVHRLRTYLNYYTFLVSKFVFYAYIYKCIILFID